VKQGHTLIVITHYSVYWNTASSPQLSV